MKNVLSVLIGIILVLSVVSFSDGKEKKKPKADATTKTQQAASWKDIASTPPGLVQASYKMDGSIIVVRFRNLSTDKTVRIRYQAKWKKSENGKWVEDASQEGVTIRLRKQEELQKDILTRSKNIKEVSVTVEADEVS